MTKGEVRKKLEEYGVKGQALQTAVLGFAHVSCLYPDSAPASVRALLALNIFLAQRPAGRAKIISDAEKRAIQLRKLHVKQTLTYARKKSKKKKESA